MSKQSLGSKRVQRGLRDILLAHAGLYEDLHSKALALAETCYFSSYLQKRVMSNE